MFQAILDDVLPIRTPSGRSAHPTGQGPRRQGIRQRCEPSVPAASWDQTANRPAQGGIVGAAWAPPLEDRAGVVVAELLQAPAGAVGRDAGRWFAFVLLACAVVCFNRL
jgi:hypothetical protein